VTAFVWIWVAGRSFEIAISNSKALGTLRSRGPAALLTAFGAYGAGVPGAYLALSFLQENLLS